MFSHSFHMCRTLLLTIFTTLYNRSLLPVWNFVSFDQSFPNPTSHPPQPLVNTILLSASVIATVVDCNEIIQYLPFCAWLISLDLWSFRLTHVDTNDRVSFFVKAEKYLPVHVWHTFLMDSPVNDHVSWFHILAVMNCVQWTWAHRYFSKGLSLFFFWGDGGGSIF